jgi:hypothetical protein
MRVTGGSATQTLAARATESRRIRVDSLELWARTFASRTKLQGRRYRTILRMGTLACVAAYWVRSRAPPPKEASRNAPPTSTNTDTTYCPNAALSDEQGDLQIGSRGGGIRSTRHQETSYCLQQCETFSVIVGLAACVMCRLLYRMHMAVTARVALDGP